MLIWHGPWCAGCMAQKVYGGIYEWSKWSIVHCTHARSVAPNILQCRILCLCSICVGVGYMLSNVPSKFPARRQIVNRFLAIWILYYMRWQIHFFFSPTKLLIFRCSHHRSHSAASKWKHNYGCRMVLAGTAARKYSLISNIFCSSEKSGTVTFNISQQCEAKRLLIVWHHQSSTSTIERYEYFSTTEKLIENKM